MYRYELEVMFSNKKSFYRKAYVEVKDNIKTLYSYDTPVIEYNCVTGEFTRIWSDWSATTGRHIQEFCKQVSGLWDYDYNKKWLDSIDTKIVLYY